MPELPWRRSDGGIYVPGTERGIVPVRHAAILFSQSDQLGLAAANSRDFPSMTATAAALIVCAVSWDDDTTTVTVSDDNSNTWNPLTKRDFGGSSIQFWYAEDVNSGATVITFDFSGAATPNSIATCAEYTGARTTGSFDVEAFGTGASTSASTGNFTTAEDDSLIIAYCSLTGFADITPGPGYTVREAVDVSGSDVAILEDDLTNTAGTNSATAGVAPSAQWGIAASVFMPAVDAGGDPPSRMRRATPSYPLTM